MFSGAKLKAKLYLMLATTQCGDYDTFALPDSDSEKSVLFR